MPSPGKARLNRFHLVKGPVYLQASLSDAFCQHVKVQGESWSKVRSCPRISRSPHFAGRRICELLHVEAGRIGLWCHVDALGGRLQKLEKSEARATACRRRPFSWP